MNRMEVEATARKLLQLCERNYARDGYLPVVEKRNADGSITPHWAAWWRWREEHGLGVSFMDTRDRWTVPSEFPPADMELAMASAPSERLSGKLKRGKAREMEPAS